MNDQIGQGLQFMLVGMSVVFGFLVLMVLVMNVAASVLKNFPDEEVVVKPPSRPKKAVNGGAAEDEIALAIAIAKSQ